MPEAPNSPGTVRADTGGGVIARYADYLPLTEATPRITLGEGSTPLVRAPSLERASGAASVYLKLESCNPTGSFKDRGMVLAVAKAIEGMNIPVEVRVGPTGRLFGSVTGRQIAEKLTEATGRDIDHRQVLLGTAIHEPGDFPVTIRLYREVQADVTVSVIPEGYTAEEAAALAKLGEEAAAFFAGADAQTSEAAEGTESDAESESAGQATEETPAETTDETPDEASGDDSSTDEATEENA